jgi:PAS domain S-box-containing protein
MRLYEQAVRSAHANGFVHNEALANELAARFYLARGFEKIAYAYLQDARYCCLRWGATAKVRQLDELYPQLKEQEPVPGPTSTIEAAVVQLDLATVVKAMQAVSREIDLGKLIETLMVIAVECAGAERGLLFFSRGREHDIEAEATTIGDRVQVILRHAFVTLPKFPESILHYVSRAQKSVILDDASVQNLFSTDEYLRGRHSRSILCVPLLKQGELTGVLYLENSLTPCVFTPDRLTVLELLASQAAISIENARLYAGLRRENADRRNAEEAVRAGEERWRKLFENSSAGIALIAPDSRYLTANSALQKMLGHTEVELQRLTVLEVTHEEDRAATEAILTESAEGLRRDYRIEKRYRRKDGTLIWVDVSTVFVPASGKTSAFFSTVSVDITERKQAEAEARQHREELAHLSRVAIMGEMAGSLAHELGQPLGAIVTNAGAALRFLERDRLSGERMREVLQDIVADGRRASEVIHTIKGMGRKEEGARQLLDLNDVIAEVLRLMRSDALAHDCTVLTELHPAPPKVEARLVQLQEVFLNLILNAFEASKEVPRVRRRIIIRTECDGDGAVRACVRDFGTGLPADKPERVFDRFFSTKREGMGIGLFIARSIVVAHGGTLNAENAEGGGAQFWLRLPASKDVGL